MAYIFLVLLFLGLEFTNATKYTFSFDYEGIVKPCRHDPQRPLTKWFDMSSLKTEYGDDGELIANGDIFIVHKFKPDDVVNIEVVVKKMVRGDYVMSFVEAKRDNFCSTMFSPKEIWWVFMRSIEEKTRKCPPVFGEYYRVNNFTTKDVTVTLPDPNFGGAYQAAIRMNLKDSPEYICFHIYLHVYKA